MLGLCQGKLAPCLHGNGLTCQISGRPGGLKIKSAGDTVEVEALSGKVQTGGELAFHRSKVHFFQAYSTTGYELFLVAGVYFFFYLPLISF
jgi:hypothetical protein